MMENVTDLGKADHVREAMQLDAQGYYELYSISLNPPDGGGYQIYLCPQKDVVWQGKTWESFPCNLIGYSRESSGENSRPKFSVANPTGVFSRYVHAGWMDNAEIIRWRVLKNHLEENVNSYAKNTWRVGKTLSLSKTFAVFELRSALDGQDFILPGRQFAPPEFPFVSL